MRLRLRLTKAQQEDFATILSIPEPPLRSALKYLQEQPKPPVRPGSLRSHLHASGLNGDAAAALTRQLMSLGSIGRRRGASASELMDALERAIEEQDASKHSDWQPRREILKQFLDSESLQIAVKSLQLSFDYVNLLDELRIVTDVRALFDSDHEKVIGAIITHVLRLDYTSDDGPHTISISASENDVLRIKAACEAAEKKAKRLRGVFGSSLSEQVFIAGEENYDID